MPRAALLILALLQARRGFAVSATHRLHRDLHGGAHKARSPRRISKHHVRVQWDESQGALAHPTQIARVALDAVLLLALLCNPRRRSSSSCRQHTSKRKSGPQSRMLAYMAGVLLCSLRVGRTLPRGGQGESGARATVPERDSAQWLHNYRLDSDHTCVDVHSRCYVVSRECMYMAWRALHSLVHYVDQAFARGRGLKRLERRPILLVVGKPGPSRQAHVKQVPF